MLTLLLLLAPPADASQSEAAYPPADPTVTLPRPESLLKVGVRSFAVRPSGGGGSALYAGTVPARDFGPDRVAADEALRAVQGLAKITEWGTVPGRVAFDYALADGKAARADPKYLHLGARRLDLKSVRAEGVRGVWLVRDDFGLVANCGPDPAAAEQVAAVCKRYGFNRLLAVGKPDPAFRLLFAAPLDAGDASPVTLDPFAANLQNQMLTRTGVPIPGGGYAGEKVKLDPRQVEARRERGEWVLAHGREVLARFGGDDAAAREAARMVTDQRLTEVCTVGGLTFFLSDGKPPTRVPFTARPVPLSADQLKAVPLDGRWAVASGGRVLATASSEAEAKQMIGVIAAFRFDTVAQLGARTGLTVFARTGGR